MCLLRTRNAYILILFIHESMHGHLAIGGTNSYGTSCGSGCYELLGVYKQYSTLPHSPETRLPHRDTFIRNFQSNNFIRRHI